MNRDVVSHGIEKWKQMYLTKSVMCGIFEISSNCDSNFDFSD